METVTSQEYNKTLRQKLSDDFGRLLTDKEFSDIEIHCDDKVLPCHRNFLAARSPVFKAMLQADMKEKQSKKIVIEDFNPRTVAHMLKFMYTGYISVDDMEDLTIDLLRAADFYELDGLKEMCEETL